MTRLAFIMATVCLGLAFALVPNLKIVEAQNPRTDSIRLMAATRGSNFDGSGLKWCVSQTWHLGAPGVTIMTSLDEVPHTASGCVSLSTEQAELAAYGQTSDTSCTMAVPCESLYVYVTSGEGTQGRCDYVAAEFFDYKTVNTRPSGTGGNRRGMQRLLHTRGPSGYRLVLRVASDGWYSAGENWRNVGTVVDDVNCIKAKTGEPGFTQGKYHVHQDFTPPTASEACWWSRNSLRNFATNDMNQRRDDPETWYIYSLAHRPGTSCSGPGPRSRSFLLREGGELDGPTPGTGAGARSLTTGGTLTTASTCLEGTTWCGSMTLAQELLVGAHLYDQGMSPVDYFKSQQESLPPSGGSGTYYWYGPDAQGYFFRVRWIGTYDQNQYASDCSPGPSGKPRYWADWKSYAIIHRCGWSDSSTVQGGEAGSMSGIDYVWSQFRGAGGVNPSLTMAQLQQEANTWAQTWIDSGHWLNVVKPAIDAMIGAARGQDDMATLGIRGNPPFDGEFGSGELESAGVVQEGSHLASKTPESPLADLLRNDASHDWILSFGPYYLNSASKRHVGPR